MNTAQFPVPSISKTNAADWFVLVSYLHAGKWHQKKFREGINRIKNLKDRLKAAEALQESRHEWLKAGWNPVIDPEFKARNLVQTENLKVMPFNEALTFALNAKRPDLAKKSYQDYKNIVQIIKDTALVSGLATYNVSKVNRAHILSLLQTLCSERKMSNHRHNTYVGVLSSMFTVLEKWLICDHNPATKIDSKPVAESNKYVSYTEQEKIEISDFLKVKHPPLLVYLQVIYHTGIRPKELLLLQIQDIDLTRRVITIAPDLERENSKTKNLRSVPISNTLWPFFSAMNLDQYPKDFFVFGSPFAPGVGNRGAGSQKWGRKHRLGLGRVTGRSGAMRLDYLTPSPYHARRDTVTNLWKILIKKQLGIDKCLYAGKHTGADDKILAGIDLDSLRNLYGHKSKYMTEIYAKKITEVFHSVIKTQSPAFTGQAKVRRIA